MNDEKPYSLPYNSHESEVIEFQQILQDTICAVLILI